MEGEKEKGVEVREFCWLRREACPVEGRRSQILGGRLLFCLAKSGAAAGMKERGF